MSDLTLKIKNELANLSEAWVSEKTLAGHCGFSGKFEKNALASALKLLVKSGDVVFCDGKYALASRSGLIKGKIRRHEKGFAFFIPEDGSRDLFVPPKRLNGIYQGDEVLVRRMPPDMGKGDECEPVVVISRGEKTITGRYFCDRGYATVRPDDYAFGSDIAVPAKNRDDIFNGAEVACEIVSYPEGRKPQGVITEVLGDPFDYKVREQSVLVKSGINLKFPEKVLREAGAFGDEPTKADKSDRTDLRKLITFTIDGDDSRDYDDAISVMKTGEGYKLYVHIADVSHYVKFGGEIDKEAFDRGTSVYLPDRVIPMLPEKLSNGLCSLNEEVDRLAVTALLVYDNNGILINKSFYKSIIRSNARLTYRQVQAFFNGDEQAKKQLKKVGKELKIARELKNKLLENADKKGFVNLESNDTKISLKNGEITVEARERMESEEVIERFMIAANIAVAEYINYLDLPFVYRVHEKPSAEKIAALSEFLNGLGLTLKNRKGEEIYPSDLQKMLNSVADEDVRGVVDNVTLRAMQKAKYSEKNSGHFGLNEQFYCHFTSPIRRYADLTVHRILKAVIDGKYEEAAEKYKDFCPQSAARASETERRADIIERSVDDIYICEFMSQFTGDYFEGVISGVTSFGFFVRLENTAEGLVKLDTLPKRSYSFDEKRLTLTSGKQRFYLGKKVIVRLSYCDRAASKLAFYYMGDAYKSGSISS